MKKNLPKSIFGSTLTLIPCAIVVAVIFLSGITELIHTSIAKPYLMFLDNILLSSFFVSLSLIVILGLNYQRLFREIKLRKEAEEEVRILRHANKARAAEILLALDENEFQVYYQPILDLKTKKIRAFEGLVRWSHPTHGILSPASFMPFIEERELIVSLTKFVLRSVATQITEWRHTFPHSIVPTISVNLSWQHSIYSDVVGDVKAILDDFEDFVPHHLCFELTETTAAQNIEQAISLTKSFRDLGISVSIDDFGTGYSSLSYLGDIPATSVKIDRSFVKRMLEQTRSDIVVRSIIKMAHELNLKVVAEGIETEEQMEHLLDLGCEFGQGYLFSKPIPAQEAQIFIQKTIGQVEHSVYSNSLSNFKFSTNL